MRRSRRRRSVTRGRSEPRGGRKTWTGRAAAVPQRRADDRRAGRERARLRVVVDDDEPEAVRRLVGAQAVEQVAEARQLGVAGPDGNENRERQAPTIPAPVPPSATLVE